MNLWASSRAQASFHWLNHCQKKSLQLRSLRNVNPFDFLIKQACIFTKYLMYNTLFLIKLSNAQTPRQPFASKCPMMGTDNLLNAPPMPSGMGGLGILTEP